MNKLEFEHYRQTWIKDWNEKYRVLDIDFETYMIMNGMSPQEYKKLNEMKTIELDINWIEESIESLNKIMRNSPPSSKNYIEGKLQMLIEIKERFIK